MRVNVVGNVAVDETFRVRAIPEPGQSVLASTRNRDLGGKGANQALVVARAGLDVRLIAAVGDDEAGQWMRQQLVAEGLDTTYLIRCSGPSDVSIIILTSDAENAIVTTNGAAAQLTPDVVSSSLSDSNEGELLVLQGNLSFDATAHALKLARRRGLTTVFNPSPVKSGFADLWSLADLVILNRAEALELTQQSDQFSAGQDILKKGTRTVVVTLGSRGALILTESGAQEIPAIPADLVDTTGAGDSFAGILVAVMALAGSIDERAVKAACQGAAICVSRPGTRSAFPSLSEMKALLVSHGLR